MDGLSLFAKYAFPPNKLGYCGPPDGLVPNEIGESRKELRYLLSQFEGAVPYLRLIAGSNNIKDEFDPRVVEAYWLGNDFLKNVPENAVFLNIEDRFKKKMQDNDWKWLISESVPYAKPHHVFHVFDIYRRAGLTRSGAVENVLSTMDSCRISWGKVVGDGLVEYSPLVFRGNKLEFGEKTTKKLISLDPSIKIGDDVSFHWDYVCDKITPIQKKNLRFWTKHHLDLTNKTI
ncbi:MAG: DUF6390 family protein [Patescibacteria group bacterium]